jgi:hypothetical protein
LFLCYIILHAHIDLLWLYLNADNLSKVFSHPLPIFKILLYWSHSSALIVKYLSGAPSVVASIFLWLILSHYNFYPNWITKISIGIEHAYVGYGGCEVYQGWLHDFLMLWAILLYACAMHQTFGVRQICLNVTSNRNKFIIICMLHAYRRLAKTTSINRDWWNLQGNDGRPNRQWSIYSANRSSRGQLHARFFDKKSCM